MVDYGVLAVEMEASALYTLAAKHGRRALAICTVSDHIVTGEETTAPEREQTFGEMLEVGACGELDGLDDGAGPDVVELRTHALEGHSAELGPGQPVEGELPRIGV